MKWIRPLTVMALSLAITVGFFMGKIDAIAFFGFSTGLIVWWFKSRDEKKTQ